MDCDNNPVSCFPKHTLNIYNKVSLLRSQSLCKQTAYLYPMSMQNYIFIFEKSTSYTCKTSK